MPALNMASPYVPAANPATGKPVLMNPFSGPKGSPFDAVKIDPTTFARSKDANNFSTGALNTGIGFGLQDGPVINVSAGTSPATAAQALKDRGFTDDYTPGLSMPSSTAAVPVLATTAILTCIGGGKSTIVGGGNTGLGVSTVAPYDAQPLLAFGTNVAPYTGPGSSRDAGAGPAFTGFPLKAVTATGAVAEGAAIETGYLNRTGIAMIATQSAFGSSTTASPAVT